MAGMFDNAKTVKTGAKPKATKVRAEQVIEGIEAVASLDAVIKSLKAVKDTKDAEVKESMMAYFVQTGVSLKARPENFRGVEGTASASCELRQRATTSPLSESEIELLTEKNIPVEVVTDTVETFVINPDYLNDPKVMGAIEAALKKAKGIPEDLFLKQEGKSKTVVAEGAIDKLFATYDEDSCADLLPLISVPAIKPKLDDDDLAAAFALAQKLITPAKK